MSTGLHKDLELVEIHKPFSYEYANAAARTGASGFVAGDVGRFARQLDDNTIWMLTATTPTWIQVGSGHTHSNQTELDLVTDGDHDVRTDNPHSVTAAQAGASATGHTHTHASTTGQGTDDHHAQVHALGGGDHSAATLAQLNAKVSDATLDDSGDARAPTSHASSHNAGGGDVMAIDAAAGTGSLRTLGTASTAACAGNDSRLSDDRDPTSHASSHQSGGGDAIKLDNLSAPDDNTDLDASTSKHGLLKKLGGGTTNFLRADGSWAEPPGSGGSTFGSEHHEAESTGQSSTTSSTWCTKVTFTTSSLPSGKYRVGFSSEYSNSKDELTAVRLTVGGTEYNEVLGYPYNTGEWMCAAGFVYIDSLSGAQTVNLQFRNPGCETSYIRNARIELWRIS